MAGGSGRHVGRAREESLGLMGRYCGREVEMMARGWESGSEGEARCSIIEYGN